MEALENTFVQLLIGSDKEADNEDVSGVPDGLLADAVESSDDEDSEWESDADMDNLDAAEGNNNKWKGIKQDNDGKTVQSSPRRT
uniref:Prothymosin alpha n=1 Tax=Haemonchus contortus TaxID=6289 RepID=A0A7I5EE09_HAECO